MTEYDKTYDDYLAGDLNLHNADLREADLSNANLKGADLSNANLYRANLEGADLRDAIISNAYLIEASLDRANLSKTNLTNAQIGHARLVDANLQGANLTNAELVDANLVGADLQNAILRKIEALGARFNEANLSNADMSEGNFDECDFDRANLSNAILTDAKLPDDLAQRNPSTEFQEIMEEWKDRGEESYYDGKAKIVGDFPGSPLTFHIGLAIDEDGYYEFSDDMKFRFWNGYSAGSGWKDLGNASSWLGGAQYDDYIANGGTLSEADFNGIVETLNRYIKGDLGASQEEVMKQVYGDEYGKRMWKTELRCAQCNDADMGFKFINGEPICEFCGGFADEDSRRNPLTEPAHAVGVAVTAGIVGAFLGALIEREKARRKGD